MTKNKYNTDTQSSPTTTHYIKPDLNTFERELRKIFKT